MPLITKQAILTAEPSALTFTALDGSSDSFSYGGGNEILLFQNTGSTEITVILKGDNASTVNRTGITEIDVSGGKSVVLAGNSYVRVTLKNAEAYLSDSGNEPTITGGSSDIMVAHLTI